MYTIEQLKKEKKAIVYLEIEEQLDSLKALGFKMCGWNGSHYYSLTTQDWSSTSYKGNRGVYGSEYKDINYSDILFESQYEIY